MESKWGVRTLGILFGAACLAHIYNVFRGAQVNIIVPEGHDIHVNEPTFELDTTITRSPTAPAMEEAQE
jgi:hypothetical protein